MKLTRHIKILFILSLIISTLCFSLPKQRIDNKEDQKNNVITLPDPVFSGEISVEKALKERRSIRDFSSDPLSISEISQVLWAAQGISKIIEKSPSIKEVKNENV